MLEQKDAWLRPFAALQAPRRKGKAGEEADLSPQELHDKYVAKFKEQREKALKTQEDSAKKQKGPDKDSDKSKEEARKKEEKKKDDKDKSGLASGQAVGTNGADVYEPKPPKQLKDKEPMVRVLKTEKGGGPAMIEISGVNSDKKLARNTVAAGAVGRQEGDAKPVEGRSQVSAAGPSLPTTGGVLVGGKRQDFQIHEPDEKLKKKNKEKPAGKLYNINQDVPSGQQFGDAMDALGKLNEGPKGQKGRTPADLTAMPRASGERRDTLSHRVQEVLAIKRLENLSQQPENVEKAQQARRDATAEIVDVAARAPVAAPGSPLDGTPAALNATATAAANREVGAAADALEQERYLAGLKSLDVEARYASFQRAALERREDAIPFLAREITQNNLLAVLAVQALANIGKLTPEIEALLIAHLESREVGVRRACADALARMKSRLALRPLLETLALEKGRNYEVRCALLDALGQLGDRGAVKALKAKLAEPDEIEIVKCHAALALARLGDASGSVYLARMADSRDSAVQMLGMLGLVQLGDESAAGYLNGGLESPRDEVWTTAVYLFARLGAPVALPLLRARLESSSSETLRRRAALAMGFLGSDEGLTWIDRAVRAGSVQERAMGCELLGNMGRPERVPLLIEKLKDSASSVRQTAAVALARMSARDALPALLEAARGGDPRDRMLPTGMRGGDAAMVNERLVMLSCVRILRGETEDLVISSLPSARNGNWPEFDKALSEQQVELIKLYQVVDVIAADGRPIGAVLRLPDGKEVLFREGEAVVSGFRIRDIALPASAGKDKPMLRASVLLMRGNERILLIAGQPAEVDLPRKKQP